MVGRNELAVIIAKVIEIRGSIDVTCYGNAMYPFLREGNMSTFVRVQQDRLQIGDICLFESDAGRLLLYRIIDIDDDQQSVLYTFRGDTYDVPEKPVPFSQIIGKLNAVHRNGKIVYVDNWQSLLLEAAVLQIPFWTKFFRWIAKRQHNRTSAI